MSYSDELRAQIAQTDMQLAQLNADLAQARRALTKLQELQPYMQHKSTEFDDRHRKSCNSLMCLQESGISNKSIIGYGNAMQDTLYGNLPNSVYAGYNDAIVHIQKGIRRVQEEILDFNHSIDSATQYRAEQVQHLNRVLTEEAWEAEQERKRMEPRRRGDR
ncbi:hypothetical protein [Bifidobacterium bombi]|uniref:hypothetical protein n=1 Tax=Bifidobacterium bombi TaxID=471511 RepID=UPI0005C4CC23|nr:hypothetical protein [Bifidobacterium bombi]